MIAILPVITRTCNMSVVTRYPILFCFLLVPMLNRKMPLRVLITVAMEKQEKSIYGKRKKKKYIARKRRKLVPIDRQKAEE